MSARRRGLGTTGEFRFGKLDDGADRFATRQPSDRSPRLLPPQRASLPTRRIDPSPSP